MDLLKTPSVQSLLDSDLESVESFQYLDIEELDEVEYALPPSEAPTLAEVLSATDDELEVGTLDRSKNDEEPSTCSALQGDFLQAVSQQLTQAQERSSAGSATTLTVGGDGKLTVGTAHGHILSFHEQTLRWICTSNTDRGAVSCLAYNQDSTRLLAGYARGLICQYESVRGIVLRRVTLGCDIWGTLKVTWAGTSGLALDTGGSVWLIKFSRPLGVRSARTSCLFSGARGEVVAMTARDNRILALATLSRVIIVTGGRAAGIRLGGPPDTLPVLEWSENDDRILICARNKALQWLSVNITGSSISLRPLQRAELKSTPLWIGWLSRSLAIFDVDENIRLWGEDYNKPLDLSYVEPVYASAFFKGHWTDGRVSQAMGAAGSSALGGACVADEAMTLLGRRGVVRVKPRDLQVRAQAFCASGRHAQALRLLCSAKEPEAKSLATRFIINLSERSNILAVKQVADQAIKLCSKYNLSDELWNYLWENCSEQKAFVEALGDAIVRGDLTSLPPSPDSSQALIEKLADLEPELVERVVASLPLTALDPHRASVFTRERRLWRGVGAIAAALGGPSGAMRELMAYVDRECGVRVATGQECLCAGGALLLAAADALAGRGAGGRALPDHAQPSARHDALHTLLADDTSLGGGGMSILRAMVEHDAGGAARLLQQSARHPPFAGPLARHNRLRVVRSLLAFAPHLPLPAQRTEILEFITDQLSTGAIPADQELIKSMEELAAITEGERVDKAWVALISRTRPNPKQLEATKRRAKNRPRVLWGTKVLMGNHEEAIQTFFTINPHSDSDIDEFFDFIRTQVETASVLQPYLPKLIDLRPRTVAAVIGKHFPDSITEILMTSTGNSALEFAEYLIENGRLKGPAAMAHLKNLCAVRPQDVTTFLTANPSLIKPEDALTVVREAKLFEAEPICLEGTGDPQGALNAMLNLISMANSKGDTEGSGRLTEAACELCRRAAAAMPCARAAELWTLLLRHAAHPPPAALLDAAAYLPLNDLNCQAEREVFSLCANLAFVLATQTDVISLALEHQEIAKTCDSPKMALKLLEVAANQRQVWQTVARIAAREAHTALARAVRAARRARAVRGSCARCALPLHSRLALTYHCQCPRAAHAECAAPPGGAVAAAAACVRCAARAPLAALSLPARPARPASPSRDHALRLLAPPRPDLEGIF